MNDAGDRLVAGGPNNGGAGGGHARSYAYVDGAWQQLGTDGDGADGDSMGQSVSMNAAGNRVAVGYVGSAAGHVRVMEYFQIPDPTSQPTGEPTAKPTSRPTAEPTSVPSTVPTAAPSSTPSSAPSAAPTSLPTSPTGEPTSVPTSPTGEPT